MQTGKSLSYTRIHKFFTDIGLAEPLQNPLSHKTQINNEALRHHSKPLNFKSTAKNEPRKRRFWLLQRYPALDSRPSQSPTTVSIGVPPRALYRDLRYPGVHVPPTMGSYRHRAELRVSMCDLNHPKFVRHKYLSYLSNLIIVTPRNGLMNKMSAYL